MVRRSVIAGTGGSLPERVLTNAEIATMVNTTEAWIEFLVGVKQRHIAADGELTSDIALKAAREALDRAGLSGADLDAIILATATPDQTFPATATKVQAALGMNRGFALDVQAVCSGFVYALSVADNFVTSGQADTVLVIGAEAFSRIVDWSDRATCVLFGDGAGAVALRAQDGTGDKTDRGVLSTHLFSDGRQHDLLYVDGGPSSSKTVGHLRMSGREVFRHAVINLAEAIDTALEKNQVCAAEVDWLVPHQANRRIIDAMARKLGLTTEKVIITIDRHANTSAASIPLALHEGVKDRRIAQGHLVLLEAMGGGFTWGSSLIRM